MTTREALHELVDQLPEAALEKAERALHEACHPRFTTSLREHLESLPSDDEPLTPEDEAAIERSLKSMREGRGITDDELDRRIASA
jgi:hypothetical protein